MKDRNVLRAFIFIFLGFSAILTIVSAVVWNEAYIKPREQRIIEKQESIKEELHNKTYKSYEELIITLESIDDISYSIENERHQVNESDEIIKNDKLAISELITINKQNYLLKIFINESTASSGLLMDFFKVHAIVTIIITLTLGVMMEKKVISPIKSIIEEMNDYKFGKKPKKRKIKNEIDFIQNEFVELTDALDEEKNEQNRIIASVSHDLKTPLTSVIGYSDLMTNKNMTKNQMIEYNQKINNKAKNMKDILNNFDEYLINNAYQTLKLENVKIKDLLNQIYEDYNFELSSNNIELLVENKCKDDYIKIDIRKIRRIFSNVIENSVRYINNDGVIKVVVSKEKDNYKFKISDNGKGVEESILPKIFDPLFTTDNSRKISGLGLSICKEFVLMHGGKIKAYNDKGLTIEFTIPKEQVK